MPRKKNRRRKHESDVHLDQHGKHRLDPYEPNQKESAWKVLRLPVPVPFTKEEWRIEDVAGIPDNTRLQYHHRRCVMSVLSSERCAEYLQWFVVLMAHGPLSREALQSGRHDEQAIALNMTAECLKRGLSAALAIAGPGGQLPSAACAFEFLTLAADFARSRAPAIPNGLSLRQFIDDVDTLAFVAFLIAVNNDLGIRPVDCWHNPSP